MRSPELIGRVRRFVVKLGTGILTSSDNHIDPKQIENIARQVAHARSLGKEVVLVSSGAVGAGMGSLGFRVRPTQLGELQACAALGQVRLMHAYAEAFRPYNINIAQVLLTHEDLKHKDRHLNARNTLQALLDAGAVPIINENDAVSFTELQFGDNDKLSALVACLIPADLLIILTSAQGLIQNFGQADQQKIATVEKITDEVRGLAQGTTAATAKGGMITKIQAAEIVVRAGIPLIIGPGRDPDVIPSILQATDIGTLFLPGQNKLRSRKRWIAFYHNPSAAILVDAGAEKALRKDGKSLLLPGIRQIDGSFRPGDVVRICDLDGKEFARGLAYVSQPDLSARSADRKSIVIHRDDMVLL